ncbi:MAG: hypothetical protein JSU61_01500 [Fidelibacterota bacterium]|nr:MAG: hypothetical protein JSU61_01500 [Candidatus Neomarinimicrobiota bacterium]
MDNSRTIDGKKYMWDGEEYPSETAAQERISEYQAEGFETELVEEDGKHYVFTRRVVTEVVVEGGPV